MKDQSEDFVEQLGHYLFRSGLTQQELASKAGLHRNTIGHWINRTSWPKFRGPVLRVADELMLSKEERKAFIQSAGFSVERWPTEVWTVPQDRDMFFTGRDSVLQSLHELLVPGSTTVLTQAISGLGGIGKTHTAVEYAYRFHKDYEAVLWLQADSWEVLVSAIMRLADELELPEQEETEKVIAEVQRWLRKHGSWLLILDNVENPQAILPKFVPTGHQGCVLVTTRVHDIEPLAQTQVLATMSEQEGVLFLLRRTKKIASAARLEQASAEQYEEARQIWQFMGGLPLALDQAGAYILETGCSFSAYQEHYAHQRTQLLRRRGNRFIGHEVSVATTFSLAFEWIEALKPGAADILRVCSLLQGEAIPEELFQEGAEYLGSRLATNGESWNLDIGVLQDYSLVHRNTDAKTLTMHRLVQAVLRDSMKQKTFQLWVKRVIRAVNAVFPSGEYDTRLQCERLLSQAMVCATLIEENTITFTKAGYLLVRAGQYLLGQARFEQAEPLLQQALTVLQKQSGDQHPGTVAALSALASLYQIRDEYEQAERLLQQALAICSQLKDKHETAVILNNLAELYRLQGKYEEAEPLYQQVLGISFTAATLNNLALLYYHQGKYEQAKPLYLKALRILQEQLGDEPDLHPDIVKVMSNVVELYRAEGEYEQVEQFLLYIFRFCWNQLGEDHPDTAMAINNLGSFYTDQKNYEDAELFLQQALITFQRQLGDEHHGAVAGMQNLAACYSAQGKYEEAEPLYRRVLEISLRKLGEEHPDTAMALNNLGWFYAKQEKYEDAKPHLQKAWTICGILDINHPLTQAVWNNYYSMPISEEDLLPPREEQISALIRRMILDKLTGDTDL